MDTDKLAIILQNGFPGMGFAISPEYPGETAYEKLVMAEGFEKPSIEDIEAKLIELNL